MPIVALPDGREVEFPDGTPNAVMEKAMRDFVGQQPPQRSGLATAANMAGQLGAGFNQRAAQVAGAPFDLVNRGLRAIGVPIPEGSMSETFGRGINAVVGTPPAPQTTGEKLAHGAGGGIADALTVLFPASRVATATAPVGAAAPSMANRLSTALTAAPATQVASGATGGAVAEATDSPLGGLAAALLTPSALSGASRFVSPIQTAPNAGRARLAEVAKAEGIPISAGQATGSRFLQNIEAGMDQLPLTSGPARAAREGADEAFTRAAWRRAGENASDTQPGTIRAAKDRIGGTIGEIADRNNLNVTPELRQRLDDVEANLHFLPQNIQGSVGARIRQIRGAMSNNADGSTVIPGRAYRLMDSELGAAARGTSDGDMRRALQDIRGTMRTAMDNSISPSDAEAWKTARREYANAKVIEDAAGRAGAGAAEGRMSPLALRQALDKSTGGGYAEGRGDLNDIARIGQSLLRAPPDSGTAGRTMAMQLLTGGMSAGGGAAGATMAGPIGAAAGAAIPFTLPRLAQVLMNSEAGQAYLRNQAVKAPGLNRNLAAALLAQQGVPAAIDQ